MPLMDANEIERLTRVDKDLYTPREIAAVLSSVSVDEVTHAVFSGELPAERAGERGEHIVGIHRADLLAWLDREDA